MNLVVILGDQLFDPSILQSQLSQLKGPVKVFMREDAELCTRFQFHKHKLIFFLSSMREYADELRSSGIEVIYQELSASDKQSYTASLGKIALAEKAKSILHFEVEDRFFESRLTTFCNDNELSEVTWSSPMFLTSRVRFKEYLGDKKRPFMKTFYESQRRRLKILLDKSGDPVGGQWSFDEDNRKALPKNLTPGPLPSVQSSPHVDAVKTLVEKMFPDHPGDAKDFWLPTSRRAALDWLDHFCREKLIEFGPYEDALAPHSEFVFHSVLTPFLNVGWITPDIVVSRVLAEAKKRKVPISSLEGFIRQVIGWREFIRGIYQNFGEKEEKTNFWKHERLLKPIWYQGNTGVPPLDQVIRKTVRYGYAHHIERLMVVGNLMLLLKVHPHEAYRWFMEMFVDSGDWVMVPNVYGMALFSDGGVFATKPYICGSNYYRKMGGYSKGDWQDGVDGLYWTFIDENREFFMRNPRLSMAVKTFDKMAAARRQKLQEAADELRERLTMAPKNKR